MVAESEAPMPPVFMHSSTMMTRLVLCTLLVIASMSKGFRLMRSITCSNGWRTMSLLCTAAGGTCLYAP